MPWHNRENYFIEDGVPKPDFLNKLEHDCKLLQNTDVPPIHFSFVGDPYQPCEENSQITRQALKILCKYGLHWIILTKGGRRAIRDFDLYRDGDSFGTTLTCLDPDESKRWEPGAASPKDRMDSLKIAHNQGIATAVSLEPVINPEATLELIRQTSDYVDFYKVGKMNHAEVIPEEFGWTEPDWPKFARDAVNLLEELGCKFMLKEDLKKYLPRTKPRKADLEL